MFAPENYQHVKPTFLTQGGQEAKPPFEKCLTGLPVKGSREVFLTEKNFRTPNTWQQYDHNVNRALSFPVAIDAVCSVLKTKQRGSKQTQTPTLAAVQGNGVTLGHISKPLQELRVLKPITFTHHSLVGLH